MTMNSCPFCHPDRPVVAQHASAFAIRDGFPVSDGHTLVIPRRHAATYFDVTEEEKRELWALVDLVKAQLDGEHAPAGYNIGINCGEAAGQTIHHLHIHVIPRYKGDVPDPRGGVRHIIPGKGNYRLEPPLATGGDNDHFLAHIRPLFRKADAIDMVASFVRYSGLRALEGDLLDARDRGARIRVLTGDYLDITEAEALNLLLDWSAPCGGEGLSGGGSLEAFVYEAGKRSFHPKSYIFTWPGGGCAFVGSSNLSESALGPGIEWNYRVEASREPEGFRRVGESFEALLRGGSVKELDAAWIRQYRKRRMARLLAPTAPATVDVEDASEPGEAPERAKPYRIQEEALAALDLTRSEGYCAGLVVMATGLGKTYLAALDSQRFERVLFVAHRDEILAQSQATFRAVRPEALLGMYTGSQKDRDAEVVFASVQTLCRKEHMERFEPGRFDYVVVDEFHHACAATYRRILSHFRPRFLLGLTATPERMDRGDLMSLCENNLVYEKGLVPGIVEKCLVPFRYYGILDTVDYAPIPWRNGKFDAAALEEAVDTQARAQRIFTEWDKRKGQRTLAFCCSTRHADYMAEFFTRQGIRAVAVHSGEGSAPRAQSLGRLAGGEIDAIFAVDIFNEGLDAPLIDTVMMLRPTESPVIFLQQLGRGLRTAPGKDHLVVIDLIGNHRSFLMKPRVLLSLEEGKVQLHNALCRIEDGKLTLPAGCSMEFEVGLIDMMKELVRVTGVEAVESLYREFALTNGRRMTAPEASQAGLNIAAIRQKYGSWFDFLKSQGDLNTEEAECLESAGAWFRELETTAMTKSFKMVTVQAMIEEGCLDGTIGLDALAAKSHDILTRNPVLLRDMDPSKFPAPLEPDPRKWERYWEENPVKAWTGGWAGAGMRHFEYARSEFRSLLAVPHGIREVFAEMTQELVDYRLAQYERRIAEPSSHVSFSVKVNQTNGRPILLPLQRKKFPDIPVGDIEVTIDGKPHVALFVTVAVNVITAKGAKKNILPEILRRWFGPHAGAPGTDFHVEFEYDDGSWTMRPKKVVAEQKVIPFPMHRVRLPYFSELKVACGAFEYGHFDESFTPEMAEVETSLDNVDPKKHFLVRAVDSSMDGGKTPIRDGDLVLMEAATGGFTSEIAGKICLVQKLSDATYVALKRVVKDGGDWYLRWENPKGKRERIESGNVRVVARFVEVVKPLEVDGNS